MENEALTPLEINSTTLSSFEEKPNHTLRQETVEYIYLDIGKPKRATHKDACETDISSSLPEVFSTWMAFGGNTLDLGSFGEETDKITDLHQIHEEILFTERGHGVAGIKRHRRDLSSDGVRDLVTVSGRGRLKEDLESST
ncbi:hypothetical protein Tco_0876086 [Tanacetum coccineum]|uniref:Uncharacterized protein n=1 Tax=Tanacetum coccineum TaxID=301880 RepID=A0ABQ5BRA4_9ASTR